MKIIIFFISLILLNINIAIAENASEQGELYSQNKVVASNEQVRKWRLDCEKSNGNACYNVGVHLAQTLGAEESGVFYYRKGCNLGYGLSCFNLGGVLIKKKNSRVEGIIIMKKACDISKNLPADGEYKEDIGQSCWIAELVEKNIKLSSEKLLKIIIEKHQPDECKKIAGFAKEGLRYYQLKKYDTAIKNFDQQIAWIEYCNSSKADLAVAYNNVALAHLHDNEPLMAKAYSDLADSSKQSNVNTPLITAAIEKLKLTPSPKGTYGKYQGLSQWSWLTVEKIKGNKWKIEYYGIYNYPESIHYGPNQGEFTTVTTINNNTAIWKQPDFDGTKGCTVTIKFADDHAQLSTQGDCGFGHNVYAEGKFSKIAY